MSGVEWTDALLDELRTHGDPEADDVVTRYFAERAPEAPRHLVGRLAAEEHLPDDERSPAVGDYLAAQPALPPWADAERIRRGEEFYNQWGPVVSVALFCASLPETYAVAKGVKVLQLTGHLVTDTRRRIYETAQMIVDVMAPGGLEPGAPGYRDARRVRLMHAALRHLILHDPAVEQTCDPEATGPHWCHEWGVPVNQEDQLAALMTFTLTILDALGSLGVAVSDDEAESYMHAWCVVAWLLGIRPDLLPLDIASARLLWAAIRRRQFAASPEGRDLTAALLALLQEDLPRGLRRLPPALMRHLVGDPVADLLGVGRPTVSLALLPPLRRVLARLSAVEHHDRFVRWLAARLGRLTLEALLVANRGGGRASFAIPTELAAAWRVRAPGAAAVG